MPIENFTKPLMSLNCKRKLRCRQQLRITSAKGASTHSDRSSPLSDSRQRHICISFRLSIPSFASYLFNFFFIFLKYYYLNKLLGTVRTPFEAPQHKRSPSLHAERELYCAIHYDRQTRSTNNVEGKKDFNEIMVNGNSETLDENDT